MTQDHLLDGPRIRGRAPRGPLGWLLTLFSNIWFGIILATLLFFYCSLGSAMPRIRQLPALEMTEFEWFHWWPFNLLVVLFCVTMVVVTLRRIPFRAVNAGVWMIHSGIVILTAGSYYYFGTKVEGDAPVFRRQVRIDLPGLDRPAALLALPGAQAQLAVGPDQWRFEVQSTNTAWPILSDEHKGEQAYAVNVLVEPPHGKPFVRQLLDGYEQYTEDVIPGEGRAIKSIGRKLVDEDLELALTYEPQEYFHVMDTWALFLRRYGTTEWVERPARGLPRYHDRIGSREQVFFDPHYAPPLRSIDLLVPPAEAGDPLANASVRVTGYLRYAQMEQRWQDGGDRLNPVLRVSVVSDHAAAESYDLVAFDRRRQTVGALEFKWLDDAAMVSSLPADSRAVVHIEVPEAGVAFDVPVTEQLLMAGREGGFESIVGTDFGYRLRNVQDNLVLGDGRSVSVAMVDVKTPEGQFTRMVADRADMTRDMQGEDADPHAPQARTPVSADSRIVMTYRPQSAPVIFAAHPDGLHFVYNGPQGQEINKSVAVAETINVLPGLGIRIDALYRQGVADVRPFVVPPPMRQRDARETYSMIRLEVNSGQGVQTKWVPFNRYVFPNGQYAYGGRFSYAPATFRDAEGRMVEVMFSRERRELPNSIALTDFKLDTHIGGYTGSTSTIRNYVSRLTFLDNGGWTAPTPIAVNAPTEFGGYWYFQSTWDKPMSNDPNGGMNYTGLGVGNRNGVYTQLCGCCLAAIGMVFAFYVKPMMQRRRYERSRARIERTVEDEPRMDVTIPDERTVVV